jgi:hypothetical protein
LILFLGGEIVSVRGRELKLKGGIIGYLERSPKDRFALELLFDRGLIRIERYGYEGECVIWNGRKARVLFRFAPAVKGIDSAMKHAIGNLGDHLSRRAALGSDGRSAVKVLKVIEALQR